MVQTCDRLLRDPTKLFRRMWSADGWGVMEAGTPACWEVSRGNWGNDKVAAATFFQEIASAKYCGMDWFYGLAGRPVGDGGPDFAGEDAPALLGFDDSIARYCMNHAPPFDGDYNQGVCIDASLNILALNGGYFPYNLCRNLEWQACAAMGKLKQQASGEIRFADAPSSLDPEELLGECDGYFPNDRNMHGYANDDIFYLEICLLNQLCLNGDSLFSLEAGEPFHCNFSVPRLWELAGLLQEQPEDEPPIQCGPDDHEQVEDER